MGEAEDLKEETLGFFALINGKHYITPFESNFVLSLPSDPRIIHLSCAAALLFSHIVEIFTVPLDCLL